jgi:hypothetical protein
MIIPSLILPAPKYVGYYLVYFHSVGLKIALKYVVFKEDKRPKREFILIKSLYNSLKLYGKKSIVNQIVSYHFLNL